MTTREKRLTVILLGVLLVMGVGVGANVAYFGPAADLDKSKTAFTTMIQQRQGEINKLRNSMKAIKEVHPRLAKWEKMSLPDLAKGEAKTDEAYKRHMTHLQIEYARYLSSLMKQNRFNATVMNPNKINPDAGAEIARNKLLYRKLSFTVEGTGTLDSVVRVMEDIHKTPLLHQIKDFSLTVPRTSSGQGQQPNALDVRFTVEALMVDGAERREDLFPKFEEKKEQPVVLAATSRHYNDLLDKNIFYPKREERKVEEKPREKREDVLAYVKLTGITRKGDRRRKATLINLGNKDDVTTIAVSPAWEQFLVRDRYGEEVVRGRIVYLDADKAVFEIDKRHFLINAGDNLDYAMRYGELSEFDLVLMGIKEPAKEEEKKEEKKEENSANAKKD